MHYASERACWIEARHAASRSLVCLALERPLPLWQRRTLFLSNEESICLLTPGAMVSRETAPLSTNKCSCITSGVVVGIWFGALQLCASDGEGALDHRSFAEAQGPAPCSPLSLAVGLAPSFAALLLGFFVRAWRYGYNSCISVNGGASMALLRIVYGYTLLTWYRYTASCICVMKQWGQSCAESTTVVVRNT